MKGFWWAIVLLLCLMLITPAASASVHTYPEGPDQVMVRSLQTLRDRENQAWQVVLFKRVKANQVISLNLRLVGFPGVVVEHPRSLKITTGTGTMWEATEDRAGTTIGPNVGEYDLREVMLQLNSNTPLKLQLPVSGQDAELVVPPFVVQEWRRILDGSQVSGNF